MRIASLLLALAQSPTDTLRVEVGSAALDGRFFKDHAARVRVYRGDTLIGVLPWLTWALAIAVTKKLSFESYFFRMLGRRQLDSARNVANRFAIASDQ